MESLMNAMSTIAQFTSIRLFIEWGVFDTLDVNGDAMSYEDLAAKVNAETALITRFAGILVATDVLKQVGDNKIAHSDVSRAYTSQSPLSAMVTWGFDDSFTIMTSMPAYFEKYGRKEPTGRYHTIHAFAAGNPEMTVWEHLQTDPKKVANFMKTMAIMGARISTVGKYKFDWVLAEAEKAPERTVLVDVGGGNGHAIKAIAKAMPGLPVERCVLEDTEVVLEESKAGFEDSEIGRPEFIATDFHKEQPVRGALIYYIRRCLHDYSDEECVGILKHICDSMASDSRLLILEQVLTNPPSAMAAATDILMASIGGKERTVEGFRDIAGKAGLAIREVYLSEGTDVSVVECVKA